jgi:hydrogenase nickel insertion protein HypA
MMDQIRIGSQNEQYNEILSITLELGKFSCVEKNSFCFAFSVFKESEPVLKNTKLVFKEIALKAYCNDCSYSGEISEDTLLCPACNSTSLKYIQGQDFVIKEMEVR